MKLSFKDLQFILDALDYRMVWYEAEIERAQSDEDRLSELSNDLYYLRALRESIHRNAEDSAS